MRSTWRGPPGRPSSDWLDRNLGQYRRVSRLTLQVRTLLIGSTLGAIFLWLALRHADLGAALSGLAAADPVWSLSVFGAGIGFMAVKTWRWVWLLVPVGKPAFAVAHRAVYIGSAANMVVPHVGEVLRSRLLARRTRIPAGTALGTVAVERVLDMAALCLISVPLLLMDASLSALVWPALLTALVIVLLGVGVIADLASGRGLLRRLGQALLPRLPAVLAEGLARQLRNLRAGLDVLNDGPRLLVAVLLSVLQWSAAVLAVWASVRAIGLAISPGICVAIFMLAVVGLTLPSAPATLGTTQLAFVAGLALAKAPGTLALAASFVYTVYFIMAVMLIGGLWWLLVPERPGSVLPPDLPPAAPGRGTQAATASRRAPTRSS